MATQNPRGVQVKDVNASLAVAQQAPSAHIVAFGVAPVHSLPGFVWTTPGSGVSPYLSVVNKPILCNIPSDFTTQLGLSTVFGPGVTGSVNPTSAGGSAYSLSELYDLVFVENNAGPLTCVNVFDPWSMSTLVTINSTTIVSGMAAVSGEVILPSITVKGNQSSFVGTQGVDYTYTYNDTTLQTGYITIISTGGLATDTSVKVTFYTPNLSLITASTIEGGTDVNGNYLGLEVLERVFSVTGLVPAIVLTPGFGADPGVIASANAHVQSIANGRFRAIYIADISTTAAKQYSQLNAQKGVENLASTFEYAGWPHVILGTKKYHASSMAAVVMQNTDYKYNQIPYVTPSNKPITGNGTILKDGTVVQVDPAQADYIEQLGLFTFLNFQPMGWILQGDYTCAWPGDTQIQDFWINMRRMFIWLGNTLSLTLAQYIDLAGNTQNLTGINETINAFGNTLVQAGAANTFKCTFNPNNNLASQVMAGIYTYNILWTPPTPIRTLNLLLQYDVAGLTAWISQVSIPSTTNA